MFVLRFAFLLCAVLSTAIFVYADETEERKVDERTIDFGAIQDALKGALNVTPVPTNPFLDFPATGPLTVLNVSPEPSPDNSISTTDPETTTNAYTQPNKNEEEIQSKNQVIDLEKIPIFQGYILSPVNDTNYYPNQGAPLTNNQSYQTTGNVYAPIYPQAYGNYSHPQLHYPNYYQNYYPNQGIPLTNNQSYQNTGNFYSPVYPQVYGNYSPPQLYYPNYYQNYYPNQGAPLTNNQSYQTNGNVYAPMYPQVYGNNSQPQLYYQNYYPLNPPVSTPVFQVYQPPVYSAFEYSYQTPSPNVSYPINQPGYSGYYKVFSQFLPQQSSNLTTANPQSYIKPAENYFNTQLSNYNQTYKQPNASYNNSQPIIYNQPLKQSFGNYRNNQTFKQPSTSFQKNYFNNYSTFSLPKYNRYQKIYEQNANLGTSPYQTLPWTYRLESYGGSKFYSNKPYSSNSVYASYLASGAYQYYSQRCANHYGQTPQISALDVDNAFAYANQQIKFYENVYGNFPTYTMDAKTLALKEKEAILMEYVTEYFAKFKCLSKYQAITFLPSIRINFQYNSRNRFGDTSCYSSISRQGKRGWQLQCPDFNSKYRTIDGSCNNLRHPYWGKSYVCHLRLLPPDYSDGVQAPRLASNGIPLPNARALSNIVHTDLPLDTFYTHMKMLWGQMVNHDITHTPTHGSYAHAADYGGPVDCCRNRTNKQCMPIDIAPQSSDYLYNKYKATCLNFVRSAPCPLCDLGPRQQINIATSFLDASSVYGSTVNESIALRTMRDGLLKTGKDIFGRPIPLPTPVPFQNDCSPQFPGMMCFVTGDQRVNQHPGIMMLHTLFLRRHNQHAMRLKRVNPFWRDERLYQEARRILIAEFQMITYKEYLPIVFGSTLMNYFSLNVNRFGYSIYEPFTDPTTWNDYSTAACRFGHSQVQSLFSVLTGSFGNFSSSQSYLLRDRFFDPSPLYQGLIDGMIRGFLVDHSKTVDPHFTIDLKNYLFRKKNQAFGSDLIARNIQRGRDHGIPGYVNYLKFCFGYEVISWDDLKRFIPVETVDLLRKIYASWLDIDFYTGGVAERHFPNADVGPTFACVLGIQYYHLKYGDRYYFEHGGQSGSFTLAQLDSIRRTTTLAVFLCRTSDHLDAIQRFAFFPESNYNHRVACNRLSEIDYNLWRE